MHRHPINACAWRSCMETIGDHWRVRLRPTSEQGSWMRRQIGPSESRLSLSAQLNEDDGKAERGEEVGGLFSTFAICIPPASLVSFFRT